MSAIIEQEPPRTRLEQLLRQRHVTLEEFRKNYQRTAKGTVLSERQAYRWVSGELRGLPYQQAQATLEEMFGEPVARLFGPPYGIGVLQPTRGHHETTPQRGTARTDWKGQVIAMSADRARDFLIAGIACGLMARAAHDLGAAHDALTQDRTGYACADNAGHDGLRAWTRGLQALITYWSGQLAESVRYAQFGAEAAARSHGTAGVWLASNEARALAALHRLDDAHTALARAADARDRVQPDELDNLGGLCTFSRPRQLYYTADALSWGGQAEAHRTERLAADALEAYAEAPAQDRAFGGVAGTRSALAVARVFQGEVEMSARRRRTPLICSVLLGALMVSCQASLAPAVGPAPSAPQAPAPAPPRRPGGVPPGAELVVLPGGGKLDRWLISMNKACEKAHYGPQCLNLHINYDPPGEPHKNCSIDEQQPSIGERVTTSRLIKLDVTCDPLPTPTRTPAPK